LYIKRPTVAAKTLMTTASNPCCLLWLCSDHGEHGGHSDDGDKYALPPANAVPDAVNWVAANRVTPVKDQGNCGCCWIFASISAIESASAIHTGQLYSLSEEQVGRISSIM
jgi:hypothetical protein